MIEGGCFPQAVGILSVWRDWVKRIMVTLLNITAKKIAKQEKEVYRNE
jgi:hypothetical protein